MASERKTVTIFTDGACKGNPGPGGYAAVLIHKTHRKELSGGFRRTTNNRMEIMAAIAGLEALKQPCLVKLHTDSKYLQQSIQLGWARKWQAKGWRNGPGPRLNWDLWERLLKLCERHQVRFLWVRGHAGNKENQRCDSLAVKASERKGLPPDEFFERPFVFFGHAARTRAVPPSRGADEDLVPESRHAR